MRNPVRTLLYEVFAMPFLRMAQRAMDWSSKVFGQPNSARRPTNQDPSLLAGRESSDSPSVVKNDADQRAVDLHAIAVVVNKSEFTKAVQKKADARASRADHVG